MNNKYTKEYLEYLKLCEVMHCAIKVKRPKQLISDNNKRYWIFYNVSTGKYSCLLCDQEIDEKINEKSISARTEHAKMYLAKLLSFI